MADRHDKVLMSMLGPLPVNIEFPDALKEAHIQGLARHDLMVGNDGGVDLEDSGDMRNGSIHDFVT